MLGRVCAPESFRSLRNFLETKSSRFGLHCIKTAGNTPRSSRAFRHCLVADRKQLLQSWRREKLNLCEMTGRTFHVISSSLSFCLAVALWQVIKATQVSGAVRHGAECFNFLFPQARFSRTASRSEQGFVRNHPGGQVHAC